MIKKNKYLIFIIFIFLFKINFSQNDLNLKANFQNGVLLFEYDFFNYIVNDNIKDFELSISKELQGNREWERLYKYPSIGISFFKTSLGNDSVYGNAYVLNPYISFNLLTKPKFKIKYQVGVGLTYATKHFDLETNYKNIAIASHLNIWFNSELYATYKVYKNASIMAGTAFSHLSNANLSEPNIGLNTWTFLVGTDIQIGKRSIKNTDPISKLKHKNYYSFIIAGGIKHTRRFAKKSYFSGSTEFDYTRILNHKFALGIGADLFQDNSIPDEMIRAEAEIVKDSYKYKSGIHLSQEIIFGDVSFILHEGMYIGFKDKLYNHKFYNRGILRYKFSDHFFVSSAMKTNIFILDVMEVGIGYYWN